MRKELKLVLSILMLTIIFGLPFKSVSASEVEGSIDLSNIAESKNLEGVSVRRVSYEEMIKSIAQSKEIPIEEVKKQHPNKADTKYSTNSSILPTSTLTAPLEIRIRQNITRNYRPSLQIFAWTQASGSFHWFEGIEHVGMNLRDPFNSIVKSFSGTLKASQTSDSTIWWLIDGTFYHTGNTTISGTASANGLVWSGSASASYETDFFKYHNTNGVHSIY